MHHERTAQWLDANIEQGRASCPLTQHGFLRVMGQPGYSHPLPLALLSGMLKRSTGTSFHQVWADDISILDAKRFNHSNIHSPKQLTDLYSLGLAIKHKGRLASFDQRIPLSAVVGATPAHLLLI